MADFKTDFAIHLDGNKLQGEEAGAILGIRVFQTRSGASAFEVIVSDPDLKWQGKPTFTDCKEVKIELGEAGKLRQVFDGEVTAWRTELERAGPTVLVLRGLDRSHRMMRARKTKTYANASPIDCAKQIAADYGLTAKTRAGAPPPVKTFRFQANQTDFEFLRQMADLEGYMFFIEGSELHFERPQIPSSDDAEFSFGQEVKTFLPLANFRKPAASVEVGAWDVSGKAELRGTAQTGDELWSVPGVKPGADLAKFTSTKPEVSVVESQVATQEHADTVAKAALTKRAMEFITAEVEVQGNPKVKPGALVNIKKVGEYSGHYLVTEANHFYDQAGYNCIFYVARDKWGDSSNQQATARSAREARAATTTTSKHPSLREARWSIGGDAFCEDRVELSAMASDLSGIPQFEIREAKDNRQLAKLQGQLQGTKASAHWNIPDFPQSDDVYFIVRLGGRQVQSISLSIHPVKHLNLRLFGGGGTPIDFVVEHEEGTHAVQASQQLDAQLRTRATSCRVRFGDRSYEVSFDLPPISDLRGVRLRLASLGYRPGDQEDLNAYELINAIAKFQADEGLPPTGELDAPTRSSLVQKFGA